MFDQTTARDERTLGKSFVVVVFASFRHIYVDHRLGHTTHTYKRRTTTHQAESDPPAAIPRAWTVGLAAAAAAVAVVQWPPPPPP